MDQAQLNWLTNFIWNIADDVLRDVYVRGKYRDVILPMTVLRRLDAVLEPTKRAVMDMKAALDREQVTNQDDALRAAAGQAFYNTSSFLLRDLKSRATQQKLKDDFEVYLDGFSPNVQDILTNFEFRNQIPRLSKADALGQLIERFLDKDINLSPQPMGDLPGLDNHSMGTMFEELVRRFNEENNEEAGEHWTPRDAVRLMANLMFLPVADKIESGTYLLYDCACGTGGMLTVAEETLQQIAKAHGKQVATHLYGQEINGETYAICKADLLLKGDGDAADNIVGGPEHSTLSNDAFRSREFDFMLANPPYGKSWKSDMERMGGKKDIKDPRFVIQHADESDYSLITRSSDGQMLFLANMLSKMKHDTPLGSRIAEVHNGSSLFTGDAGQGESNIRRWIIESDWLEAIVALPLNMFYNTGIATYVWVLTNRKPEHRRGKVQLIDATQWFRPLRKNMGKKNCELAPEHIQQICDTFLAFQETPQSKIFPNAAFGYWKVKVERPLRLRSQLTRPRIETLRFASGDEEIRAALYEQLGDDLFEKPAAVRDELAKLVDNWGADDAGDDDENGEGGGKKGLPEKTKKKLLDPDTWKRDAGLVETAEKLRTALGDGLFEDHNVFLEQVDAALKKLGLKLSASDLKLIVNAVSWRDEAAPPVIKKVHKPGKIQPDPLRGLDPHAPLKPSGIPWLGDIPRHWEVRKLRTVSELIVSNIDKHSKSHEEPVRLCNYTDVYKNESITESLPFMRATATSDEIQRFRIKIGDVVITKDSEEWDDIGVPALVRHKADDLVCGYHLGILRPHSDKLRGEFLLRALQDQYIATQMHVRAKGVTRYGLSHQGIKDTLIPLPSISEQEAICAGLLTELRDFTAAIARTEREIALMQEYRTRLTADVVTGKLDVRPAAAKLLDLPAEPAAEEALEENEELDTEDTAI